MPLCRANIGAALQQRGRIAHGDAGGRQRDRGGGGERGVERAGGLSDQRGERVEIGVALRPERQQRGLGLFDKADLLFDIEGGGRAALETLAGEGEHLALAGRGLFGKAEAVLAVAQVNIGACYLGGEADLRVGDIGLRGFQ